MFEANEPIFQSHTILTANMLNEGITRMSQLLRMQYSGYSSGILSGVEIKLNGNSVILTPGIIIYQGCLYHMEENYELRSMEPGMDHYIKIAFHETVRQEEGMIRSSEIIVTSEKELRVNEMLLAHFHLENGVKLRNEYQSFKDFATNNNTINIIDTPYASIGESSLSPKITAYFGEQMMKCNIQNPVDAAFVMECLKKMTIPKSMLISYITNRLEEQKSNPTVRERREDMRITDSKTAVPKGWTNQSLYEGLEKILASMGKGPQLRPNREIRRIMI